MEFTAKETVLELLRRHAVGLRAKDDEFFQEGNVYIKPFVKLGVLSEFPQTNSEPEDVEISCNVPDCNYFCQSVIDYEFHYNAQHRYTCAQCKKSLPNAHLLDLHLSEMHDSYFAAQVQASNRPMYACYLEECKERSKDPAERRDHCIREHKFPHNFRFDKQTQGELKASKVMKTSVLMVTEGATACASNTVLEAESKPVAPKCRKNFSFGHPQPRTFKAVKTKSNKCDILESNKMVIDMLESLPRE
ncbi:protein lethal(2)k10201 [Anopheles marshallii]|uniref:protein lethal(2)k10201 n=1 Tax=Anopheles marshallii TaxID=1521116 RepID=UPI00237A3038|nr:protein lethal(2)k10201 [Anopheles marshallii]